PSGNNFLELHSFMLKPLFFFLGFYVLSATGQKIEGTVYDTTGKILPFSSILVKGTQQGVTANAHGNFSFTLLPGTYTLACMHVGYTTQEKTVILDSKNIAADFALPLQKLVLKEVIIEKGGEDPAYNIIRAAIKKRPFYEKQVKAFEAEVYIKGILKLKNLPRRILGQKIPEEDRNNMGLDSTGKGIIYLSESVTRLAFQQAGKVKLEVISGRESGSNGFGFNFPAIISFYENNVNMFESQLSPRGFISPIADGALNYYTYKFLGSFFEDGKEINVIKVIPVRDYEPLFSGVINISENDWRIYSCDLFLTKKSQLEILDSLEISQIHVPVNAGVWRVKNQVLHFSFKQVGIDALGDFVNVYSKYNLDPHFPKNFFNRVIMKYDTAANKKTKAYWDSTRPVPLEPEEVKDYKIKDSIYEVRKDPTAQNIDSLKKRQGKLKLSQLLWTGVSRTHYSKTNTYSFELDPLLKVLQYNTIEGVAINPSISISKFVPQWKSNVSFITDLRYGFNNNHFNAWAGFNFKSGDFDIDTKFKQQSFFIAGGKRVSQFFKESTTEGLGNTIGTLLYGRNNMKIYENYFGKAGFSKQFESGTRLLVEGEYEDRIPLDNTTDFILNKKFRYRFTPNYPVEVLSSQFKRHQAVILHVAFSIKPGQKYIEFPNSKIAVGSKYPEFTLDYTKGFKNILGSDVDFDKWSLTIADNANLKMAGALKYNLAVGGFLNTKSVFIQDFRHFKGNISHVAKEYVRTFQLAPYYGFSNTSSFFAELHFEHHLNGLLSNKIPLIKKFNWNFVDGTNALYINPNTQYAEVFIGLENIFKLLRFDVVAGFQHGNAPVYTYRIGFDGLLGAAINVRRFGKRQKVIDEW
ncbi:MAG: DUF5686 and carboxypeptidase regulatory-like domain-containing protein, partial [Ginsengibacter sp.]